MVKEPTVKINKICPTCFAETGYSIVLEENDRGILTCPRNPQHKFKVNKEGFLEKTEAW